MRAYDRIGLDALDMFEKCLNSWPDCSTAAQKHDTIAGTHLNMSNFNQTLKSDKQRSMFKSSKYTKGTFKNIDSPNIIPIDQQ